MRGERAMNYQLEQLIPIVAELANKYTGKQSSSITYERAEMLMEAVLYCIQECFDKRQNTIIEKGNMPTKLLY